MTDVFQGNVNHFPKISVDYFVGSRLKSLAFFLSHCHTDHIKGLDSLELKRLLSDNPNIKIYSTQTTGSLVLRRSKLLYLKDHFSYLTEGDTHTLCLSNNETLNITLIPANHCPGSVMFLFSNDTHRVLYTGDFRYQPGDEDCLRYALGERRLNSLYLDTTFYTPKIYAFHNFPSRYESEATAVQFLVSERDKHPNLSVHIDITPGWENIFIALAKHFDCDIGTTQELYQEYQDIDNVVFYLTTLGSYWMHTNKTNIHCPLCLPSTYKLRPSVQWILHNNMLNKKTPIAKKNNTQNEWYITHSMHSSYTELKSFIDLVSADQVYPIATPHKMSNDEIKSLLKLHWKENRASILQNKSYVQKTKAENSESKVLVLPEHEAGSDHENSDISTESADIPSLLVVKCKTELLGVKSVAEDSMINQSPEKELLDVKSIEERINHSYPSSTSSRNLKNQKQKHITTTRPKRKMRRVPSLQFSSSSSNEDSFFNKKLTSVFNLKSNIKSSSDDEAEQVFTAAENVPESISKQMQSHSVTNQSSSDNEDEYVFSKKQTSVPPGSRKNKRAPRFISSSSSSSEHESDFRQKQALLTLETGSVDSKSVTTGNALVTEVLVTGTDKTMSIPAHTSSHITNDKPDVMNDCDLAAASKWIFSSDDDADINAGTSAQNPKGYIIESPSKRVKIMTEKDVMDNLYNEFMDSDSDL